MKDVIPLTEGWTLRHDGAALPARVPGCVHTDLLAAGLIPDPYLGTNERDVAWVGRRDWTYTARLAPCDGGHERTDLVFDGLDTVAEVVLAGDTLGASRNMHRSVRYDVTGRDGALEVRLTSAYTEADAVRGRLGERPGPYDEPFQFVRKMACSFGWDWGPTLVTAGIWRPVRLEHWSVARLTRVRPLVTVGDDGTGRVELRLEVARTDSGAGRELTAHVAVGGVTAAVTFDGDRAVLTAEVPDAALWWPRGYGEQPLYDCEVTLAAAGEPLDTWTRRIGFRTVALDTSADGHGTRFTLVVNGEPVFARGVNWIPDDALPSRVTPARYRERLEQAAAANVDLIRVWGGGIYEDESFYTACDELGLLVWQDFPFACAAYPEEQPLRGEVDAEARENVVRLMPHPSLVLWNGNNENLWGFRDWDWEPELAGDSWGEGYYLGLLPRIVAELDPTRPYWPGSPWSGSWDHHPNDPAHGTHHSWDVWNRQDYTGYLHDVPRFSAEFGWQAPAAYATMLRAVGADQLAPHSEAMLHHQKAEDGNGKLERGLARHFTVPDDFDRWHYLTQLNQARAVATGVEHWRSHWPLCAGTVVWQFNDCWPVTSWAAIDGDARPKPLWYELRRLYADRLLTLSQRDGRTAVAVCNQGAEPWETTVSLRRTAVDGTVLASASVPVTAAARSVALADVPEELVPAAGSAKEFLVAEAADGAEPLRAWHFPVRDKDFAYPRPEYDVTLESDGDDVTVVVAARTLVRDLVLQADRLAPTAVADRGRVTLLPGERVRIGVRGWARPRAEDVRAALFSLEAS
ncbi:glycoside hydrolase family 2 protein [Streptomyces sp. NPDC051940]|uniref:glycoside hydrolase family 2 protein n=1 Tax=Streptomyces sp. NPDC051940 TaxID=3155675 RepID=UPI0034442C72